MTIDLSITQRFGGRKCEELDKTQYRFKKRLVKHIRWYKINNNIILLKLSLIKGKIKLLKNLKDSCSRYFCTASGFKHNDISFGKFAILINKLNHILY